MSHPILVMTRPLPLPPLSAAGATVEVRHFDGDMTVFDGARVLCSTALDSVGAELIAALPESVKLIANIGVGYDSIDLQGATARGIAVSNTPVVTGETADLAFLLILASSRQLFANEAMLRAGQWSEDNAAITLGHTVRGKTLGIIGFGEIGQAVARRANAFDMEVVYHGPNRKAEAEAAVGARYCEQLDELLATADIVSLHCPLSPSTERIINADALATMKAGSILVNTGRGALVDEAALVAALTSGHLAAAGLDVFENEPEVHPGLLTLSNVTLSPHIGSATAECRIAMVQCALGNVIAFFEGRELPNPVVG
jgi:glyoxylate reductase